MRHARIKKAILENNLCESRWTARQSVLKTLLLALQLAAVAAIIVFVVLALAHPDNSLIRNAIDLLARLASLARGS